MAAKTIEAPMRKDRFIGCENIAMDARKDTMIDKDVANPFLQVSLPSWYKILQVTRT